MLVRGEDAPPSSPDEMSPGPLPGAPESPANVPSHVARVAAAVTLAGGLLCAAIGVAVMVAWLARATAALRFGSQTPMVFNTALALAVTGAALAVVAARRPWAALAAGVFDTAFGLAVLAEYLLGRGLGIDQLIVKAYVSGPASVPGRPAVNTAVCLAVTGAALLVWGPWRSRRRPAALAAAGSVIAAIALVATFGYIIRTPAGYGWAHLSAMPFLTAAALLVLALTLLSAAWRETRTRHDGFPRWLPMPAGVLALGVASAVWLAIAGRGEAAGQIRANDAAGAATVLGLVLAGLVAVVVWLAQQSDQRRQVAEASQRAGAEAKAQAQDGERRLFQFLDAIPAGVFVASPGGVPYYANRESERVLGRGVTGTSGSGLAETYGVFVAGTDRLYPAESMPIVRALRGESSHLDDQEIHQPDGAVVPIEIWGRPVYGDGGKVEYAIAAFADMSERNDREQTIVGQAALLELAHDAIFVRDPDGHITYWNTGAEHTYGFTRAEALGRTSHQMLRTEFPEHLAGIEETMARDGRWEGELTQRRADGRTIVTQSRWAAQRGTDRSLLGFMEVNRDITARKDAEREMRRQAALLELAHDAIFVRDPDGHITYWNTGAERTYGFTRAEALGRTSHQMLRTEFPEHLAGIEETMARDGRWEGELTQRRADGRTIVTQSRWAAQRRTDGSLLGFMEVNRDITARKDAEREMRRVAGEVRVLNATLEQQVQERTIHLERANKSLAAFTYSVAHDLRTPLRGISGFAEALAEDYGDRLDETGREYAARVQAGCARMATLIDDLLHLSQVTRAEMKLQDVDLSAEVTAICDQLRARDPGRRVRVTVQDGVRVTADKVLIRDVLENLLGNAWKFTAHRDGAAIEFATTPVTDAPVCCYVRDNGAGFDPAYTGKLFQPFQRLHDASEFPGTGIGLASVRRIIDRHDGRTWAEGAIDGGATIYFTLNAKGTP